MDWNALLTGLGVIGGALVVFLLFVAITIYMNRRRNSRLREADELREQQGSDVFTMSSEDPLNAGVSLCSEVRTDLMTTELSIVSSQRHCPPLRKLNLEAIGVRLEGVTVDETTTDLGLLSRGGLLEFERLQREHKWSRLRHQRADDLSQDSDERSRDEQAKLRMMQAITSDTYGSTRKPDGLDQRLLTYLSSTLLDDLSTEEEDSDSADIPETISSA